MKKIIICIIMCFCLLSGYAEWNMGKWCGKGSTHSGKIIAVCRDCKDCHGIVLLNDEITHNPESQGE